MLVRNLTPLPFGYVHCSRKPPQSELTFVVRGKFNFKPGEALTPVGLDRYLPDYVTEEQRAEVNQELDRLAQGSLRADEFADDDEEMKGELVFPSDFGDYKPKADVMLRGACHPPGGSATECTVRFKVGGWQKRLRVVGPRAWVDRVAGGKMTEPLGFEKMPLDYAHAYGGPEFPDNPAGMGHASDDSGRVWCVEHLDKPVDKREAATFAPINPNWPIRHAKQGTKYGKDYMEKRFPYYAEDFDWTFFNAAPPSQQIPYLRGDEELEIENMHPDARLIKARLPGLRMRVFARTIDGRIEEIPMALDTLLVDLDEGVLYLAWRGLLKNKEEDLTDVPHGLVVGESLVEPPKDDTEYRELLEQWATDPMQLDKVYPNGVEQAFDDADEASDIAESVAEGGPEALQSFIDEKITPILGEAGKLIKERVGKVLGTLSPEQFKQHVAGSSRANPMGQAFRQLDSAATNLRKEVEAGGGDTRALDVLDKKLELARERVGPIGETGEDEPGPGSDCRGQDLRKVDLKGRDLRGCDFTMADLSKADLSGADLSNANLQMAVLYRANLTGAKLHKAKVLQSDLTLADCTKCDFSEAEFHRAIFRRTTLTEAVFDGGKGAMPNFSKATLTDCSFKGTWLYKCMFENCNLVRTTFEGADLMAAGLRECKGHDVVFRGAKMDGASVEKSTLLGADFSRVEGELSAWRESNLDGANLRFAKLKEAHFQEMSAPQADLSATVLRGARFYRANLSGAKLDQADLFGADFRKASIDRTRFNKANLYKACFMDAYGVDVDFAGANLDEARFERCKVVRK